MVWLIFVVSPGPSEPPGPFPLVPGPSIFPWSPSGPEYIVNHISETANTPILGIHTTSSLRGAHQVRWGAKPPASICWVSRREEAVCTLNLGF